MFFKRPYLNLYPALLLLAVLLPGTLSQVHGQAWEKNLNGEQKIIIIDPGHGGRDHGASGSGQASEKAITLSLAHILKKKLTGKYEVVLTRTGDYALGISERGAIANGAGGNLLISLHSVGDFTRKKTGIKLYYYREEFVRSSNPADSPGYGVEDNTEMIAWDEVHLKHDNASRDFVDIAYQELGEKNDNVQPPKAAPLLLFAGLNMPAICVEIVCPTLLSHGEKNLNEAYVEGLAGGITKSIDLFFGKKIK